MGVQRVLDRTGAYPEIVPGPPLPQPTPYEDLPRIEGLHGVRGDILPGQGASIGVHLAAAVERVRFVYGKPFAERDVELPDFSTRIDSGLSISQCRQYFRATYTYKDRYPVTGMIEDVDELLSSKHRSGRVPILEIESPSGELARDYDAAVFVGTFLDLYGVRGSRSVLRDDATPFGTQVWAAKSGGMHFLMVGRYKHARTKWGTQTIHWVLEAVKVTNQRQVFEVLNDLNLLEELRTWQLVEKYARDEGDHLTILGWLATRVSRTNVHDDTHVKKFVELFYNHRRARTVAAAARQIGRTTLQAPARFNKALGRDNAVTLAMDAAINAVIHGLRFR